MRLLDFIIRIRLRVSFLMQAILSKVCFDKVKLVRNLIKLSFDLGVNILNQQESRNSSHNY